MNNKKFIRPEYIIRQEEDIPKLQKHYDNIKPISLVRIIYNIVFSIDKTLFALISGALTGISTNVLTEFLDFNNIDGKDLKLHIIQLALAVSFNCFFILFSARIIEIQESGDSYMPPKWSNLDYQELKMTKYNAIYSNCVESERYLKVTFCISVILGVIMLISFFDGYLLVNGCEEVEGWLRFQWTKFMKQ